MTREHDDERVSNVVHLPQRPVPEDHAARLLGLTRRMRFRPADRTSRSAMSEASYVLAVAEQLLQENFPNAPEDWFLNSFVRRFTTEQGPVSGDRLNALFVRFRELPDDDPGKGAAVDEMSKLLLSFVEASDVPLEDGPLMVNIATAVAYAVDAIKAHVNQPDAAWSLVADAQYVLGICTWKAKVRHPPRLQSAGKSKTAVSLHHHLRSATEASHAPHYEAKARVWEWCGQHFSAGMTITAATGKVFDAKLVDVGWDTIYSYISQWRKLNIGKT